MAQSKGKLPYSGAYNAIGLCIFFFMVAFASFEANLVKWELGFHELLPKQYQTVYPGTVVKHNNLPDILDGTADRPFAYRRMLPDIAGWVDRSLPIATRQKILFDPNRTFVFDLIRHTFSAFTPEQLQAYGIRFAVVYLLNVLSSLVIVWSMYGVCRTLKLPPFASILAPAIMVLLIPYGETIGGYAYDYPEFAFLALAVYLALRFPWWVLIPFVLLGTWNKESFLLFLPTLYPLVRMKSSRLVSVLAIGVLCVASASVYLLIKPWFAHNGGGSLEFHLLDQLRQGLNPKTLLAQGEWTYSVPMLRVYSVYFLALVAWTAWRGWADLHSSIRFHTLIALAINLPLYILFCAVGELRDLSMLYVPLMLLIAANIAKLEQPQTSPA